MTMTKKTYRLNKKAYKKQYRLSKKELKLKMFIEKALLKLEKKIWHKPMSLGTKSNLSQVFKTEK